MAGQTDLCMMTIVAAGENPEQRHSPANALEREGTAIGNLTVAAQVDRGVVLVSRERVPAPRSAAAFADQSCGNS
jgi:hypothetical protein